MTATLENLLQDEIQSLRAQLEAARPFEDWANAVAAAVAGDLALEEYAEATFVTCEPDGCAPFAIAEFYGEDHGGRAQRFLEFLGTTGDR